MESAVILAGGKSSRIGRNKALLDFGGEPLIGRIYKTLQQVFEQIYISANDEDTYRFLGAPIVKDLYPGGGSLAGIHSGLHTCTSPYCFFVACDMPFLNIDVVRYLYEARDNHDIIIPVSSLGYEPLHAFYSRRCLTLMQRQLEENNLKIIDLFSHVDIREVSKEEIQQIDPDEMSYFNINTADKYELACRRLKSFH